MSEDACIKTSVADHVATVTLHQPARRNAMRLTMWQELGDTMARLAADHDVRVVVVTGAGEHAFCAGADISEFAELRTAPEKAEEYDAITHVTCTALRDFPKPTIGRIRGSCIGGGMELALLCDIRLAADDAKFGVTPAKLGLGYNLDDTVLLVERLGAPAAREILFTGRIFAPEEALRLGIVNRVVAVDELDALVAQYATDIAHNAPLTLKASKAIIAEANKIPPARDEALCAELVAACYASDDFVEGQTAFSEKRKPAFTGR
ncbi:MAG: enoyl-CoA hydratase [Pseudomonadota bacterium]